MRYIFGDCELDTHLYTLRRAEKDSRLPPRVYKVLTYLLEHRDRVVSKDELCEQVWPEQFIANATLESAIRLVRQAIGDSGRAQRMIQTSWGYGYRFVETVVEQADEIDQKIPVPPIPPPLTPVPARVLTPFMGRQNELAALHDVLGQMESGQGRVAGLVGAPGSGKSRLLHEFCQSLRIGRVTHLEGRCLSNRSAMPYLPIVDIVWQSCKLAVGDSLETMTAKVHDHLRDIGMNAEEQAPYLLRLLDIPIRQEPLVGMRPELLHVRTLTTICRMLQASSRQRPVLITIEDVHWMDRGSEDCLASLSANFAHIPILLLVTFRPDYQPAWMESAAMIQIAIPPLTAHDRQGVHRAGLVQEDLPAGLEQAVMTQSSGNPLLMEELSRLIREQEATPSETSLPNRLGDVLSVRINRLSEAANRLLQTAAVLGQVFSKRLLQVVWEGPDDLETCLSELAHRRFCYPQLNAGESIYLFEHEEIQAWVYEHLPQDRRQMLHTAAAQALERLYEGADGLRTVSDLLAHHHVRSRSSPKAVESLIRLAETAVSKGVHAEAVQALQEALAHTDYLPRDQQLYCYLDVMLRQAQSRFAMGHVQEAISLLTRQHAPLEQLQDAGLMSRYTLLLSQLYRRLEDWETAAHYAQSTLAAATPSHDHTTMGQACYVLAEERYWSGCFLAGIEFSQEAIALLEPSDAPSQLGMAHVVLGLNALQSGDFAQALRAADQARTLGLAIGEPHLPMFADWLTGWTQSTCGEWEAGIEACQRGLERVSDPLSAAMALGWLGYAYLENREPAEAIPLLEQAIRRIKEFERRRLESLYTTFLSEAYLAQDACDRAYDLALQGLSMAQETTYRIGVAWAQRALGHISQAANSLVAAEPHFREALATFEAVQARFEIGRTHLSLATLTHLHGNLEAAMMHLTQAYNRFNALQVPTYIACTQQRLHELKRAFTMHQGKSP